MSDNRPLRDKILKADPRMKDLTARGKLINLAARFLVAVGGIFFVWAVFNSYKTSFWTIFSIYIVITWIIGYYLDQICVKHFTFAAEKKKLDQRVKATTEKALKNK